MVGMLDELMLQYQLQQGGGFPAQAGPTPEEIAAASQVFRGFPRLDMGRKSPFDVGAAPIPGIGMLAQGAPPPPSRPPMGDPAVTSLDGGPIPMPRPNPLRTTEMGSRAIAAEEPGAPLSLAPPGAPGGLPAELASKGGGLSFRAPSPAMLFALASGFSGAPSFGTGMRRAFGGAAGVAAQDDLLRAKQETTGTSKAELYRSLVAKGVPPGDALAAVQNPKVLEHVTKQYYGEGKEAPAGYRWNADRTALEFIPKGPADPATKRALGDRQNAPSGYLWNDPNDPSKGMTAIKGGPAEKIDAQVASRIGLGQSFLDQLPKIRADLEKGDATGPFDAAMAKLGYGRAGELRRQIDSGAEALLRNLTGAGMNMQEANDYASRYKLQPWDTTSTIASKMNQLERELQYVMTAVSKDRGGAPTVVNGKLMLGDTEAPSSTAPTSGKTKSGISWSVAGAKAAATADDEE